MRKLNRVIAAGALAVPMALGASGIAVAAEGGSEAQNQVETSEGNGSGSDFLDLGREDSDNSGDDNFLEDLLRSIFGEDDDEGNSGNDSIIGGNDEGDSGNGGILNGNDEGDSEGNDGLGIL